MQAKNERKIVKVIKIIIDKIIRIYLEYIYMWG